MTPNVAEIPGLVSVVIVNYNGASLLKPCLESVFAQTYRSLEVIVVDNGSSDGSAEMVRRSFPDVRLIVNAGNVGFAEANNRGTQLASSDRIVLLNNDTVVESAWLAGLLDEACRPGVGVVTSKVVTEGVPSVYYQMNGTINYLGYNIMREFSDLSEVFFAGGASLCFSRSDVGMPFLPEYFLYHEDVFLSWRMRLRGYAIRMAQSSLVRHAGSATTRQQPSRLVTFYQERNRLLNCLLLYEGGTLVRLTPLFIAEGLTKLLLSLVARRKSAAGIISAYWWCIGHRGWIRSTRASIQKERRVSDSDVMRMMSHRMVDSDRAPARFVNWLVQRYARAAGLAYHA